MGSKKTVRMVARKKNNVSQLTQIMLMDQNCDKASDHGKVSRAPHKDFGAKLGLLMGNDVEADASMGM